jgi:transcriptional regulator with XRE-family HTH domain
MGKRQSYRLNLEKKMPTTAELIAGFKARLLNQKQEAHDRLQSANDHGIKYSAVYRKENLRLLREFFNASQEQFAILLGVSSQSAYSQLERGDQDLSSTTVRKIERDLGIPENWFDRDNSISLFLSQDEIALVNEVRGAKPKIALTLADLIKSLGR